MSSEAMLLFVCTSFGVFADVMSKVANGYTRVTLGSTQCCCVRYLKVGFQLIKVEPAEGNINALPDGALLGRVQLHPVQLLQLGPLPAPLLRLHHHQHASSVHPRTTLLCNAALLMKGNTSGPIHDECSKCAHPAAQSSDIHEV